MTTATRPPTHSRSKWDTFLFEPESPSPMALLRIGWGALVALWAITLLPDIDPFLTDGALRYDRNRGDASWNLLDHFHGSGPPMAVCVLLIVAALATCVGWRTRLSSLVAVIAMVSLQRTNTTLLNAGDLVLRLTGVFLFLSPAGLLLSRDAVRLRRKASDEANEPPRRAPWALRALQINIAVGYFLSGWAKLQGSTWHEGTAVPFALRIQDLERFAAPSWLIEQGVLMNLVTWATLAFELSFPFLVWRKAWRPWVLGVGIAFHLGIDIVFDVGFFSYAMILTYLAFIPPQTTDRWAAKIRSAAPDRLTR